jgi:hypothetical protein
MDTTVRAGTDNRHVTGIAGAAARAFTGAGIGIGIAIGGLPDPPALW